MPRQRVLDREKLLRQVVPLPLEGGDLPGEFVGAGFRLGQGLRLIAGVRGL